MTRRPSATAALVIFWIAMALSLVVSWFLARLGSAGIQTGLLGSAFLTILLQGAVFAVPAIVYYARRPQARPGLRLRGLDPMCALLIVVAAILGMLALNWLTVYWMLLLENLGLTTATGNETAPRTAQQLWLMLASAAIAPALFEELLFRGMLLPSMERLGRRAAVLISGGMFALMHGRVESLPAHLLLGCVLALLVLRTDSLLSAMLYHGVYNGMILIASYLSVQTDPASLDAMPTVAEAVRSLPTVIALLCVWALLLHTAMRRGAQRRKDPTPAVPREPLSRPAKALLVASIAALLLLEGLSLADMLPGAGL